MKAQGQLSIVMDDVPWPRQQEEVQQPVPASHQRKPECKILSSRGFLQPKTRHVLLNRHFMALSAEKNPDHEQLINLAFLSPKASITTKIDWRWLTGALFNAGCAVVLIYAQYLLPAAVFSVLAFLCGLNFFDTARKRYVFHSRLGSIALLDYSFHLFGFKKHGPQWIALLQQRIVTSAQQLPKGEQRLKAELAEHRRLFNAGYINQRRYDLAKQRILKRFSQHAA
jgi:hypothetical protein